MKRFILLFLLSATVFCYGRQIVFVSGDNAPIPDVRCTGYSSRNDSIASWISDKNGVIEVQQKGVASIVAAHSDFSDRYIKTEDLNSERNVVVMTPAVALNEVVVTPQDVEEFTTHTSYRLSEKEMERYTNVYQSLNLIPNLTVLSNGSLFLEGNQNIKILIDGVETTRQEVSGLSKEDILKVDVYQTPPLRFAAQGVDGVVNIRLKSSLHGGNGSVNIHQAFQSLVGDNSLALFYNYRQSRFSLLYDNENRHYRKYRLSEVLDYDFDGVHYKKEKKGLDSKNHLDDNALNLSYQLYLPENLLYNIKAGVALNRSGGVSNQEVTTAEESFLATNRLYTEYTKWRIGNYFEKNFGGSAGKLLANINYQHYSTSYSSAYNEMTDAESALKDSHSDYKTHLDAVFSEIQYQFPHSRIGDFTLVGYETYKRSKYVDTTNPFYQTINGTGGLVQWMYGTNKLNYFATLGFSWNHTSTTLLDHAYNQYMPVVRLRVNWKPTRTTAFSFDYSYDGDIPTIAQLSETDQWIDTRLVYHGNAILKPYKKHSAGIRFVFLNPYINLASYNRFESSPGMICDMYTTTERYMLQTMVNLSSYKNWSTQFDMSIRPLGNTKFVFWNRVILADVRGRNKEYSWHGTRFQWMSSLMLNLSHWSAELFYQYPGKIADGQLVRPRAQCWSVNLFYRPNTNLSLGVECFMPFGKGFKESEHTVRSAPVYADTEINVMDRNNLISFRLSYNFSFGKNKITARPEYDNLDFDSGILRK